MCSHESSARPWPAVRIGRIARGGETGGLLSGRGGGVSWTLSQTGMCLHAPSPLHSHSHEHAAHAAVQDCAASATAVAAAAILMPKNLARHLHREQCAGPCPLLPIVTPQSKCCVSRAREGGCRFAAWERSAGAHGPRAPVPSSPENGRRLRNSRPLAIERRTAPLDPCTLRQSSPKPRPFSGLSARSKAANRQPPSRREWWLRSAASSSRPPQASRPIGRCRASAASCRAQLAAAPSLPIARFASSADARGARRDAASPATPEIAQAAFATGCGTASRMGMLTTAATAASAMSAYHIQS